MCYGYYVSQLGLYVFCLGAPPSSMSGLHLQSLFSMGGIGHPQYCCLPPLSVLAALLALQLMLISTSSFWVLLQHMSLCQSFKLSLSLSLFPPFKTDSTQSSSLHILIPSPEDKQKGEGTITCRLSKFKQ